MIYKMDKVRYYSLTFIDDVQTPIIGAPYRMKEKSMTVVLCYAKDNINFVKEEYKVVFH